MTADRVGEPQAGLGAEDLAAFMCRTQAEMVGNVAPAAPCDYHKRHAAEVRTWLAAALTRPEVVEAAVRRGVTDTHWNELPESTRRILLDSMRKDITALTITVVGTPAPQGSKRGYVVNGRVAMVESSKKVKPWRQDVKAAAHEAMLPLLAAGAPFIGPLDVAIVFDLPRPGYHFRTGARAGELKPNAPIYVAKKPDVDKLVRSTLDGLKEAGVYRDDSQVAHLDVWKQYADRPPGAVIHVRPLTDPVPTVTPSPSAVGAGPTSPGAPTEGTGEAPPGRLATPSEAVPW